MHNGNEPRLFHYFSLEMKNKPPLKFHDLLHSDKNIIITYHTPYHKARYKSFASMNRELIIFLF